MSGPVRRVAVTIKDVAERAGVSQMTVSRVLNNKPLVSEATRERVRAAMRDLNYRPNLMARNLAGRSGLFIGLLYANPSYGYLSEFLLGGLAACRRMGHHLVVEEPFMREEAIDPTFLEDRLTDSSLQAVLVIPPLSDDPELIHRLTEAGVDFVRVSASPDPSPQHPTVGIDDRSAAADMTRYLMGLGHERIAVIGGPSSHLASQLRFEGFCDAMLDAGREVRSDLIIEGDFTYRSGLDIAEQLFAATELPTAVFAFNDDMAAGAITGAYRARLDVPGDVSIVGFDDTANAASLYPPLTTVRQPIRQLAEQAIELLVGQFEGTAGTPAAALLDYEIIERASAAPPARTSPRTDGRARKGG